MTSEKSARGLVWALTWRFLRGRRSRLLDGTARAALAAIAIGVFAMVIAMALMTGYREDLQRKLVAGNAAVIVYPLSEGGEAKITELARAVEGVESVRRVLFGQGALASEAVPDGVDVTFRGASVALDEAAGFSELGEVERFDLETSSPAGDDVLLGEELAKTLEIAPGDVLRLTAVAMSSGRPRFRFRSVRVVGTFRTGFSEFDQEWVVIDRPVLEELVDRAGKGLFEVVVEDLDDAAVVADTARLLLGPDFLVTDWREMNGELFTALKVQQVALFFVLGLIVLVSTFNVASTLVVLVRERMREIGVLSALGLAPELLRRVFFLYGSLLSAIGVAVGVLLGTSISWFMTRFEIIRFDAEVASIYFIESVPFRVRLQDLAAIVIFTVAVTLIACWLPARRAGRIQAAEALRYE